MLTFDARMAKVREGKRFVISMWFLLISRETQVGVLELVLVRWQSLFSDERLPRVTYVAVVDDLHDA
jgi:hypothetical protein